MSDPTPRKQGRRWARHNYHLPAATYNDYASREAANRFEGEADQDAFYDAATKVYYGTHANSRR